MKGHRFKEGFVEVADKQRFLDDNYPFENAPALHETKRCIHCDLIFRVEEYKVFMNKQGMNLILCPNSPECNGTVIDWVNASESKNKKA